MHKPIKYVEKGLSYAAKGAWVAFDTLNRINPNPAFTPKWSELPLQKSWQKVKPPLGWPRETDSPCPNFVHELTWDEIKTMLDNAITLKPKRQMSVQFSGGEPTMSPYFLDAVRYAKKVGYNSVQAATNGIEFAKSKDFAKAAFDAGLRYAYLQFDGIGNAANSHRLVGNLFDVKLRAIENLWSTGVDIVPVITIVNGINNEQVGRIVQFALDNPRKINFLSFQPVSFTGRDEEVTPERRAAQRYTLSHLAHDV